MFDEYFEKAQQFIQNGIPFATAVIVHAEKPTSGKVGDKALITTDGTLYGWIGGSCAQPTVSREAVNALEDGQTRLIRLSPNPAEMTPREGLMDLPMTCFSGGTLEIYIEPQYPKPRLIVVGDMLVARTLIELGQVMGYDVVAVDPDGDGETISAAQHVVTDLTQIGQYVRVDSHIVVATHGNFDEVALEHAINANASYIGLVSSKKRFEKVTAYLLAQGLSQDQINRINAPAGLDIQAQRGDEIALSIIAEIVQVRRNRAEKLDLAAYDPAPTTAIDPVCGMEVNIASAKATYQHDDTTYYFCCDGCQANFAKNPAQYLTQNTPSGDALDPVCGMTVDIATAQYMSDYQGEKVYFCGAGCKMSFDENPEKYLAAQET